MTMESEELISIASLQRQVRRLRWTVSGLCVSFVGLVSAAFASPSWLPHDVISARRFVVLDDSGQTRAVLGMIEEIVEQTVGNPFDSPPHMDTVTSTVAHPALRMFLDDGGEILLGGSSDDNAPHLRLLEQSDDRRWEASIDTNEISLYYGDEDGDLGTTLDGYGLGAGCDFDYENGDEVSRGFSLTVTEKEPARLVFQEGDAETVVAR